MESILDKMLRRGIGTYTRKKGQNDDDLKNHGL
jgi:hypothetical protein